MNQLDLLKYIALIRSWKFMYYAEIVTIELATPALIQALFQFVIINRYLISICS